MTDANDELASAVAEYVEASLEVIGEQVDHALARDPLDREELEQLIAAIEDQGEVFRRMEAVSEGPVAEIEERRRRVQSAIDDLPDLGASDAGGAR